MVGCVVWRLRRLAVASFGGCVVWRLRRLAVASFGGCLAYHTAAPGQEEAISPRRLGGHTLHRRSKQQSTLWFGGST